MIAPVKQPQITSRYGIRLYQNKYQFHSGIDLVCGSGTKQVYAVLSGYVRQIVDYRSSLNEEEKKLGIMLTLQVNAIINNIYIKTVRYFHFESINVNINQLVQEGQLLGKYTDHIHTELWKQEYNLINSVNEQNYVMTRFNLLAANLNIDSIANNLNSLNFEKFYSASIPVYQQSIFLDSSTGLFYDPSSYGFFSGQRTNIIALDHQENKSFAIAPNTYPAKLMLPRFKSGSNNQFNIEKVDYDKIILKSYFGGPLTDSYITLIIHGVKLYDNNLIRFANTKINSGYLIGEINNSTVITAVIFRPWPIPDGYNAKEYLSFFNPSFFTRQATEAEKQNLNQQAQNISLDINKLSWKQIAVIGLGGFILFKLFK